ncbi:sigma-54 interaction domain-containing protein [Polaromonas naphthalenivorans]|uniref:Sigma54 specific transcriptional regulator, Fis family n=1 Tax=Polaromonas naphthalenivorans (strain CJ2) TaxID=365044 RepID=A1VJQ6_POLNA|nr:sigma-54 dependent transcriptional regulator [Polaromonas naphthalenivorans]ABM35884.1 sigma54 specific transcriptional regulator, Fis family [Polaromonas naphthalenivorans CJ2]
MNQLLTFPDAGKHALSIRAKALVFEDPQSQALLARLDQVAPTEATVVIIGETGTGKELLARRIHQGSARRGPFVAVNCGAFSESLIDAELFGHESGAFTGASQARAGWFEAANGGSLFLDEIGDLPLALQVKLLRVLQERQIVRIGSRKPIELDVRLIAATNVDLRDAVNAGHFRADLYYRLSVATLELRPLWERPGDILPLARHFLASYAKRLGIEGSTLTPGAEQALLAHDWPGNIRELENVVHYALIVAPAAAIHASDLQSIQRSARSRARQPVALPPAVADSSASTPEVAAVPTLRQMLRELLLKSMKLNQPLLFEQVQATLVCTAFEFCHNNQVQTARLLGLSRNVLRTLLKQHGLLAAHEDSSPDTGDFAADLLVGQPVAASSMA